MDLEHDARNIEQFRKDYPVDWQDKIWILGKFIKSTRAKEDL